EIDPNGNVTRYLHDDTGRHFARMDPLGHLLPTSEENPNPPDPLAYELPETPLEWEHGRLLSRREIRSPAIDDPILRAPSLPVVSRLLELDVHYSPHLKDDPADPREEHAPASEDGDRRPVEQGPPDHLQQWKYDNNGNL